MKFKEHQLIDPVIKITDAAAKRIRKIMDKEANESFVRITLFKDKPDPYFHFGLTADIKMDEGDRTWLEDGFRVVINEENISFLKETILDYSLANLSNGGFILEVSKKSF